MKKIINCDLCGTPCTIEGDDKEGTHYYVPVKTDKDKLISELEKELALYKKALEKLIYFLHNLWSDVDGTPNISQEDCCNIDYWLKQAEDTDAD